MLTILELVLLFVIMVLIAVLILETREYRRTRKFTGGLERAIAAYTSAFTALAETVHSIEKSFEQTSVEQEGLTLELIKHAAILEIHNKALNLSPTLMNVVRNEASLVDDKST